MSESSMPGKDSPSVNSGVAQTANIGRSTSVGSGAAKVFREFKWGLLTLFLLMVVVIALVYDGGKKKKPIAEGDGPKAGDSGLVASLDGAESGAPPVAVNPNPGTGINVGPTIPTPVTPVSPTPIENREAITVPEPMPPIQPAPIPERPVVDKSVPPTHTPPVSGAGREYTVKGGDTLTSIANSMLPGKGGVKAIIAANKDVLPDPNRLKAGMTLKIPSALPEAPKADTPKKAETIAEGPKKETKTESKSETANEYVVQNGDTLERIARKVFNDGRRWREIYEMNREQLSDPGRLRVGQTLKIKGGAHTATAGSSARAENEAPEVHIEKGVAHREETEVQVMSSTSPANIP